MTMHRRPLGGGRSLAAFGGVLIVLGAVLPWWRLGGNEGIPALVGTGFEGAGIIVFLVGIATLLLVTLPYAVGDRPTAIDRWQSYAILAVVGWLGFGLSIIMLVAREAFRFSEPVQVFTNGPGLWLAAIGLAALSRAVYRMTREPLYR